MKPRKSSDGKKYKVSPRSLKGKDKLLARWTDGLFYFVKITKVSEANKTCMVEFEDMSTCNVHFKDLLEAKEEGIVKCHCCGKDDTVPSNVLVSCSNCERDYHQACHVPPLSSDVVGDDKFICRICVFASCAQAGGAKTSGPLAEKYAVMKQHFPYDIKYLTWNATHTSNVEQSFCYCGGPGSWYNKMLQCCRCRQWFHEACIQCLEEELLIGDRFFLFACAHCNQGEEFIQRLDINWVDISYITLFHLIMTMGTRYIDLDTDMLPFIMGHAHSLGLKKLLNGLHGSREAIRGELVKVLKKHSTLFCCGSEVKKRCTYYGIRERIPPSPPSVLVPVAGVKITQETLADGSLKRTHFLPSKYTTSVPYVLRGANKVVPPTMGARVRESKLAKIARVKTEHNYCTPLKYSEESHSCRGSRSPLSKRGGLFDANNNSPSKQTHIKKEIDSDQESNMEADNFVSDRATVLGFPDEGIPVEKRFWSLDIAFPEPVSYSGPNHPFLTEYEQENLRRQKEHFGTQLERLASLHALEDGDKPETKSSFPILSPLGASSTVVKGFKGELADLIHSSSNSSTPKKRTSTPEKQELTPEKLFKVSPTRMSVSPRRHHSPGLPSKETQSPRGSSLSPLCVNGVKISPNIARSGLKNGLVHFKSESLTPQRDLNEDIDSVSQKRMKALNRCLKNLTPTCGFHFPVLEETHPAVVSSDGILQANGSDIGGNGFSVSSAASSLPSPTANSKPTNDVLSRSRKKGRKRKLHLSENSNCKKAACVTVPPLCGQNAENVRRSHRSRSTVNRLEATLGKKSYDIFQNSGTGSVRVPSSEQYEVISLRVGQENGRVEYLIDWSM